MKGVQGLIIAIALGILGAIVNFFYLNNEAHKRDMVSFIGIKKGKIIGRGDKLTEGDLVKVDIPANLVGNLKEYACKWEEVKYILEPPGKRVWQTLDSSDTETGLLLLESDFREPPKQLELAKGERAEFIAAPRNFDTQHLNPGDKIWFRVMTLAAPRPAPTLAPKTPAAAVASATTDLEPKPEDSDTAPQPTGPSEYLGPFVIVSIGNRLGTLEVQKAAKITPAQQNLLLIRISPNVPKEKENFEKLTTDIARYGANCYSIQLAGKE
jgi:hypothetical protein